MNIGNYLKLKKKNDKNFNIQDFCKIIGVSRQQLNKYVNNKAFPSSKTMKKISVATFDSVQPNDFFNFGGE